MPHPHLTDYFDDNLIIDYLHANADHVDLGSWQRYTNRITGESLRRTLKELSISIDEQNIYVPNPEYAVISDNMMRASAQQATRGKRNRKYDVRHDSQIYYLIDRVRNKPTGEVSIGYNTYLLTLDGSLTYFTKLQGISWSETYFLFPNQWYELAFPFLRMQMSGDTAKQFLSLAFSSLLPALKTLVPLEIYRYVFDLGGVDLSMKSVHQIIDAMTEERLVQRLDPSNKDIREREEAALRLQRLIADQFIEENQIVEQYKETKNRLQFETEKLSIQLNEKEKSLQELEQQIEDGNTLAEHQNSLKAQLEAAQKELVNLTVLTKSQEQIKADKEKSLQELEQQIEDGNALVEHQNSLKAQLEAAQRELIALKNINEKKEQQDSARKEIRYFMFRVVLVPLIIITIGIFVIIFVANSLIEINPLILIVVTLIAYTWYFSSVKKTGEGSKIIRDLRAFESYQQFYKILILVVGFLVGVLGNATWDYLKSLYHLGPK